MREDLSTHPTQKNDMIQETENSETRDPSELNEDICSASFNRWWFDEGSGIRPDEGDDIEEFAKGICSIAWKNGSFKTNESIFRLRNEINCRIEHGADSNGHLEYVQKVLDSIFS